MTELSVQQRADFKEAFTLFDKDCDEKLTIEEVGTAMRALHQNPSEAELAEWGGKSGGMIGLDEFLRLMGLKIKTNEAEEQAKRAFQVFDREGNGYLKSHELKHIMMNLGDKLSEQEANAMIKEADVNGDGKITLESFLKMMA